MLSEFALSPALFRLDAYESSAVADVCLGAMFRPLLDECVVRNLRNGEWSTFTSQQTSLHMKAREFLKKLSNKNRLISHGGQSGMAPTTDEAWEQEALNSHQTNPLAGLIFHREAKEKRYADQNDVSCPERLHTAAFWRDRPCTCRVARTVTEYRHITDPLIHWANFIAFIDPHLDPTKPGYRDFLQMLPDSILGSRSMKPKIEIHRVAWLGNGSDKRPVVQEIERIFRDAWSENLRSAKLSIEVYLWDNFHDRFLLTDLLGTSWSNGFDMTSDASARVTVSRLSRIDFDGLQLEFATNSTIHTLIHQFVVG